MGRELTPTERSALAGKGDGKPLRLEGRSIADLRIEAAALGNAEWRDVDLLGCELAGTAFRGAAFEAVTMKECLLEGVSFEASAFTRWSLTDCRAKGLALRDCRVQRVTTSGCRLEGLACQGSRVEDWEDQRGELRASSLADLRIERARWKGTELVATRAERVAFAGGTLADVSFVETTGGELAFRKLEVDGLSLAFGNLSGLNFEEVKGRGVALNELAASGVRVAGCELGGLTVGGGSKVRGMVIERSAVAAFTVLHAEVHDLRISDAQLPGLLVSRSRIAGRSVWERVVLVGPDLGGSTFEGLELRDCTADGPLRAAGARFRGLRLEGLRRGPQLRLLDEGATYEGGDRLTGAP